jgi:hypothetical protein
MSKIIYIIFQRNNQCDSPDFLQLYEKSFPARVLIEYLFWMGLTQEELIKRLDCPSIPLHTGTITYYEKNVRDPSSIVLLKYAKLAKVHLEVLVDDELDLPFK